MGLITNHDFSNWDNTNNKKKIKQFIEFVESLDKKEQGLTDFFKDSTYDRAYYDGWDSGKNDSNDS